MRFGVVIFPGSNCEQDVIHAANTLGYEAEFVWHGSTDLSGFDAIVLPGGFSYGDYIRCGAVARFSPVMAEVIRFAGRGGPVLGICNGFQILAEAHLLPGALLRNRGLKFICREATLKVEPSICQWLDEPAGTLLRIPINHNEGNYICDEETLARLNGNGQVVLRYCEPDGTRADGGSAPNGALDDIAGICNERGNVFGLMPHPERVVDPAVGGTDGAAIFTAIARRLAEVV
ncbi:MAG: phosphoribosylformylglycinamidine synthase subunit PurQ [Actinomycetota bacterium]|nr:MAG: phosphoribosylformylglycinamidine [Actinomycetota bacterium]MDO8950654.1 phosphoribosylformylglycinamidine synthase subunit PurQ [Actinomycetota bacterium]MDP3631234.1 phosphoribosylformylglycinamidine synthase subunit PurQ [Actinomycetota bacterium]